MTYAELQARIADYLHRDDLTANIPQFIELAEASIFRELNVRDLETSVSGTSTAGLIALPADFGRVAKLTVTVGSVERTIDYMAPPYATLDTITGPGSYALEQNQLRMYPGGDYAYTLIYIPRIEPLATAGSNWLLTNAPDLYLYASAMEGAKYIRDNEQAAALAGQVGALMDSIRRSTENAGLSTRGALQIKPRR